MSDSVEVQGVTVEEAIQLALNQLGLTRDRVEIKIQRHPRKGFLGVGARRAQVRATPRPGVMEDGQSYDMAEQSGRRRRGRRRGGEGDGGASHGSNRREGGGRGRRDDKKRDDKKRDDNRNRGGGASAADGGNASRQGGNQAQGGNQESRSGSRRRRGRRGRGRGGQGGGQQSESQQSDGQQQQADSQQPSRQREKKPEKQPEKQAPSPPLSEEEKLKLCDRGAELMGQLIASMGFPGRVSASLVDDGNEVVVRVRSETDAMLVGPEAECLDALEHLLNRMIHKGERADRLRVTVDIGDYRALRTTVLEGLAARLGEQVINEVKGVQLAAMSPADRRVFQGALAETEGLKLRVLGSGFYRKIRMLPVVDEAVVSEGEFGQDQEIDSHAPVPVAA